MEQSRKLRSEPMVTICNTYTSVDRQCNTDTQPSMERDTATSHPPLLGIAIFCPQKSWKPKQYYPCLGPTLSVHTHNNVYTPGYTDTLAYTWLLVMYKYRTIPCSGLLYLYTHTQQYLTYRHRLAYTQLLVMYKYRTIPAVAYSICTHTQQYLAYTHARLACWSCTNTERSKDLKI